MEYIHKELHRKSVTQQLLWEDSREAHPDGYQRSQFCQLYRDWTKTIDVSIHQTQITGEKGFVIAQSTQRDDLAEAAAPLPGTPISLASPPRHGLVPDTFRRG